MNSFNVSSESTESQTETINSKIQDFKKIIKQYNLNVTNLPIHTDLSVSFINKIIKLTSNEYILSDNESEETISNLNSIIDAFTYNGVFSRLTDTQFLSMYIELKKEFPYLTSQRLAEKARKKLTYEYDQYEKIGKLNKRELVFEQYGKDVFNKYVIFCRWKESLNELNDYVSLASQYEDILENGLNIDSDEYDDLGEPIEVRIELPLKEKQKYQAEYDEILCYIDILEAIHNSIVLTKEEIVKYGTIYTEAEKNYLLFQDVCKSIPFRRRKNIDSLYARRIQADRIKTLTADQQKAILSVYLDLCLDKNGFILPNHFGSGIRLIHAKVGKSQYSQEWVTEKYIDRYKIGNTIPQITRSDKLYLIIAQHKMVFFKKPLKNIIVRLRMHKKPIYNTEIISQIMKSIANSSVNVRRNVFDYLRDELLIGIPHKAATKEYYKFISEYTDILSLKLPIANNSKHNKEIIYRIVYEICSKSKGELIFSNELVNDIAWKLRFKAKHWLLIMYIQSYCYKHKEIDSLLEYIEHEKEKEYPKEKDID